MGDVGVGGERGDFYCDCQHEYEHVLSVACGLVNTWMDACGMTFNSNRRLCDCSGGGELRSDKTSERRIKASPPKRVTARVKEKEKERSKRLCSHHCISLTLLSAVFKRENCGGIPAQSKVRLNLPRTCGRTSSPIIMLAASSRAVVPSFRPLSCHIQTSLPADLLNASRWSGRWEPRWCCPRLGCKLCLSCRWRSMR